MYPLVLKEDLLKRMLGIRFGVGSATALLLAQAMGCGDSSSPAEGPKVSPDGGTQQEAGVVPDDAGEGGTVPSGVLPGPSHGSAVALSPDDSVAVMVNRDVGSVSIFDITYPQTGSPVVTRKKELSLGAGSEPWQVVVAPDGVTAFVLLRKDQKLVKIGDLKGDPKDVGRLAVGSEPTGLALTPTGARVWVANWVDGTLMAVDTETMVLARTVDLNAALVATGLLGGIAARPALAHPRSVAITNNGDANDDDESVLVTEYFGQRTAPEDLAGGNADTAKSGLLYKVKIKDAAVSTIRLGPVLDMGFADHTGGKASCYPNQLQSVTINAGYAYVTSVCASPKGPIGVFTGPAAATCADDTTCPGQVVGSCNTTTKKCATNCSADAQCGANTGKCVNFTCAPNVANVKTTTAPVVSVVDLARDTEVTASTASLNAQFAALYTARGIADDGTRRFPGIAVDMAFVPATGVAYVAANAADAVFRVKYDPAKASAIVEVGSPGNPFLDLNPSGIAASSAGKNPIGVTIGSAAGKKFAFVANDVSRNLTVLDFNTQAVAGGAATPTVAVSSALPAGGSTEEKVLKGKRFFDTGVGRWSLKGQAWSSCQSCHTDGLTDNVTWYFNRGTRQSTSLDGTYASKDATDRRILNWTAIFDEVPDFDANTRGISGGVGALVSANSAPPQVGDRIDVAKAGHAGLNGSATQLSDPTNPAALPQVSVLDDWLNITEYVKTIRSPRKPSNLDAGLVAAGHDLFTTDGACQGCHGGDKWTISKAFYTPSLATMTALSTKAWAPPSGFPQALLPAATNRFMRFPAANAGLDQIQCMLRPVGTFGVGDALAGISELRQDMTTQGQGNEADGKGFNPPSLLGLSTGAPYLHAGQATSLESLFATTFAAHHAGPLAPNFLSETDPKVRDANVQKLVAYLLSIDEDATTIPIPAAGATGGDFCGL